MASVTGTESEAARRQRIDAERGAYEKQHADMIPGSSKHDGRHAEGGRFYADRARMAAARRGAGLPLDAEDTEALRRHPQPTGYVGE